MTRRGHSEKVEADIQQCVELDRRGFDQWQIAEHLGIKRSQVSRYLKEAREFAQNAIRRTPQWLTDWVERLFDHLETLRDLDREAWGVLQRAKDKGNDDRVLSAISTIRSNANERARSLRLLDPRISIDLNVNLNEAKEVQAALFAVIMGAPKEVRERAIEEMRRLHSYNRPMNALPGHTGGSEIIDITRLERILRDQPSRAQFIELDSVEAGTGKTATTKLDEVIEAE